MAGNDVFLYSVPSDTNPNDVRLRDPTTSGAAPGAISGTATLTFSQSGAITGAGALVGTNGITFGQTGSLHGDEALSGTATLTFGQTGALAGAGALAGTVGTVFGETGALTANGALAGSTTLVFGQSGDLTGTGGGSGAITGTVAFNFGQSGALTADGALTGNIGFTFGQSGTLVDATPPSGVVQTLGSIGPWRDDKQERARQRRFREIAEAELELRDGLAALIRGDKPEAQEAFDRAIENVEAAQDDATPYFSGQLESLRADIAKLTTLATIRQTQVKLAADHAARIQQMMDDDEAIITLLLN